jgi:hypothetical protein
MSILSFLEWLQATPFSTGIRESTWWYPVIESVHVLSLCLFLGLAVFWDARLLYWGFKRVPVSQIQAGLMTSWVVLGFVLMVISGTLLFVEEPVRFYGNIFFRVKVVLLIVAGLNAFIFHSRAGRRLIDWDNSPITPTGAKLAGAVSLSLWALIVICGRFIAYNWFKPLV